MPPNPFKILDKLKSVFGPRPVFGEGEQNQQQIGRQISPVTGVIADFLTGLGAGVPAAQAQQQQRAQRLAGIRRRSLQKSKIKAAGEQQEFQNQLSLARVLVSTEEGGKVKLPSGRTLTIEGELSKRKKSPNRFVVTNNGRGGVNIVDRFKLDKDPSNAVRTITPEDIGGFQPIIDALGQGLKTPFSTNERSVMKVAFETGGPEAVMREFNRIQTRREKAGKKTTSEILAGFRGEDGLRGDYLKELGELPKIMSSFVRVNTFSHMDDKTKRNAQSDIAMVFSFMKMLDPPSVVREGEQALASNAGGIPEQTRRTYNNMLELFKLDPNARILTDNQVDRMFEQSQLLFNAENQRKLGLDKRFKDISIRRNLDFRNVINEDLFVIPGSQKRKFKVVGGVVVEE